jgi:GxxExxY protein
MNRKNIVGDLLFKEECYKIIGLCMKVHALLGKGFKEIVYKDALEIEFKKNTVQYEREKRYRIQYEEDILKHYFCADFILFDCIILEVKAAYQFHFDNFKQTLNYLKVSGVTLGLLVNFGENKLTFKRIICTY